MPQNTLTPPHTPPNPPSHNKFLNGDASISNDGFGNSCKPQPSTNALRNEPSSIRKIPVRARKKFILLS